MPRLLLLLVVCLTLAGPLAAQPAPEAEKLWIFLAPGAQAETVAVTEAAVERRQRRGAADASRYDATLPASYLDALADAGVEPVVTSRWLQAVSAYLTPTQREAVERLPFVRDVRPVRRARSPAEPVQPMALAKVGGLDYGASEAQLDAIDAIPPLERGINGEGVRVGFLDSEYGAFAHEAFALLRAEDRLIEVRNFTGAPQSSRHGQTVASVAVGYAPGVLIGPAYGATVLAATTEYAPTETNAEEDFFVAGLEWLEAHGADVVNVSLGYSTFDIDQDSYTPGDLDGDTGVTTRAVDIAASLGVTVVTSAGNAGCGEPADCWYYITTPADADSVITVGAVTFDGVLAPFSSRGPTADGRTKPDVVAPGVSVVVAVGTESYAQASGTSFSAPLVTGVVAQMLQVNPDLGPIEVRDILRQTADQADSPDNFRGWGLVNADAAVLEAERRATGIETPPLLTLRLAAAPNPAMGVVTLTATMPQPLTVVVYDTVGRIVARAEGRSPRLDTSRWPAGLYAARATSADGQAATATFVVVR